MTAAIPAVRSPALRCSGNWRTSGTAGSILSSVQGRPPAPHSVSFVSVTQQFNTTTSMGRLTLNVLLSFAQFEREVTGERIRDKIGASKRRGLWVGGMVPLGYVNRDKKLFVEQEEAERVRTNFRRYLDLGSIGATAGRPSGARDHHQSPPSLGWADHRWHPFHQRPARLSPAQPVLPGSSPSVTCKNAVKPSFDISAAPIANSRWRMRPSPQTCPSTDPL
jgi:hypothetical protein